MTRIAAAFWILLVLASGFATFKVKYAVQNIDDQLNHARKQTIAEQQEIRVLNAEWTYLNQPERLADLNRRFLHLAPISARQLQERIDQIAFRIPAAPPSAAYQVAAAAVPPPAPMPQRAAPAVPVSVSRATAPVASPASPDASAPVSLDALIAQIEPVAPVSAPAAAPQSATQAPAGSLDNLLAQIEPIAVAEAKPIPAPAPARVRPALAKGTAPHTLDALIARIVEKK